MLPARPGKKRGPSDDVLGHESDGGGPVKKVPPGGRNDQQHQLPCVDSSCNGRDRFISDLLRKLETNHGTFICSRCYTAFESIAEREAHGNSDTCKKYCISGDCGNNRNAGNDAASVRNMRHVIVSGTCPSRPKKRDQWRLIYAIHNPHSPEVPDLEFLDGDSIPHGARGTQATRQNRSNDQQFMEQLREKDERLLEAQERIKDLMLEKQDELIARHKSETDKNHLDEKLKRYLNLLRLAHNHLYLVDATLYKMIELELLDSVENVPMAGNHNPVAAPGLGTPDMSMAFVMSQAQPQPFTSPANNGNVGGPFARPSHPDSVPTYSIGGSAERTDTPMRDYSNKFPLRYNNPPHPRPYGAPATSETFENTPELMHLNHSYAGGNLANIMAYDGVWDS